MRWFERFVKHLAARRQRRAAAAAVENRKRVAIDRALRAFTESRRIDAMGGHVLHVGAHETVVRVMFVVDRIPPERVWYAVPIVEGRPVRELSFDEVQGLETGPWR